MPAKPAAPKSVEEALARGYRPSGDLAGHRRTLAVAAQAAPAVDCNVSPPGTLCFNDIYPDGSHVVGYCDGNGNCQLYTNPNT